MILRRALPVLALPSPARAKGRMRRIAVIVSSVEGAPDALGRAAALREGLRALGWVEGRNIQTEYCSGAGDVARAEAHARERLALAPDLVASNGTPQLAALQRHNRSIPVVFVVVVDPVGAAIARFAIAPRMPLISGWRALAEAGALIAYGQCLAESYRRLAYFVDRILRGTPPENVAIERPRVFELAVNLRTAAVIGVEIPVSLLSRTDLVIE